MFDSPAVVVEEEVMSAAEEDAVCEVRFAAGAVWVDVVGFAPGWWAIAFGPAASAVSVGERDSLRAGEQPPGASEVQWFARAAEDDREGTSVAEDAARGRGGERFAAALEPPNTGVGSGVLVSERVNGTGEVIKRNGHAQCGLGRSEDRTVIVVDADADKVDEDIQCHLLVRSRIIDQA
ncbi:MAG TPA: hypothetical protein VGO31_04475, partial [Microbacteriaceae bacterium]|nr:hypothetical protein [Microbacteriaceae bacterium]